MQTVLHIKTKVLPGHKIEISTPTLPVGDPVEVTVTAAPSRAARPSALDLLDALPGGQLFKTPEEADEYLRGERDSWDR